MKQIKINGNLVKARLMSHPPLRLVTYDYEPTVEDTIEITNESGMISVYKIYAINIASRKLPKGGDYVCRVRFIGFRSVGDDKVFIKYRGRRLDYDSIRDVWNMVSIAPDITITQIANDLDISYIRATTIFKFLDETRYIDRSENETIINVPLVSAYDGIRVTKI